MQAIDRLLVSARQSAELLAGDARAPGDLGQIASLNRYELSYLRELRASTNARAEKQP